jgi:hypothetical protein
MLPKGKGVERRGGGVWRETKDRATPITKKATQKGETGQNNTNLKEGNFPRIVDTLAKNSKQKCKPTH